MVHGLLIPLLLSSLQPEAPARNEPVANSIADIPNTTVRYYDVSGKTISAINRSIAERRPAGAGSRPATAATDWAIKAGFDRREVDGKCNVVAARVTFSATADLPRLVQEKALDPALRTRWRTYIGQLEASAVATLLFVHENLGAVEKAILASNCDTAKLAGSAAIERLRAHATAFEAERARLARKDEARDVLQLAEMRPAKLVCRDLQLTGSRLRKLNVCMPLREWERLHESGQKVTREMQDQSISAKYF